MSVCGCVWTDTVSEHQHFCRQMDQKPIKHNSIENTKHHFFQIKYHFFKLNIRLLDMAAAQNKMNQ